MLPRLEVRVWEADEDLRQLTLLEEIGHELHCVGSQHAGIAVQSLFLVLRPQRLDPVLHELRD